MWLVHGHIPRKWQSLDSNTGTFPNEAHQLPFLFLIKFFKTVGNVHNINLPSGWFLIKWISIVNSLHITVQPISRTLFILCVCVCVCVCVKSLSRVRLFATLWTVARQAPLSMGFSRQEYWSGFPFPSPGDFPTQGSNPSLLLCRQTLYPLSHQGSLVCY